MGLCAAGRAIAATDLAIDDGEFLVLLGPSGCGKTTVLRMIAGLETVSAGSVVIGDRLVTDLDPAQRDIAFVFQNYALYPHMTVRQNISFCLENMRLPKREITERVEETARLVRLSELLERLPEQLSGGQRQRVAIARAVVRRSKVLLMDEPLSNLDARLRGAMRADIARIQAELGVTTVYVTHDQIEAMTMADRIVIMRDGAIEQVGAPMDVYRDPINRFVADFLGSPSMNFLDVSVEGNSGEGGGGLRLRASGVDIPLEDQTAERLRGHAGGSIVLGFRPQSVVAADPDSCCFRGCVKTLEPYGCETYVGLDLGDTVVSGRVEPTDQPVKGETFGLSVKPDSLHFFDPATGITIR